METSKSLQQLLDEAPKLLARFKRKMRRAGFNTQDIEDFEQELLLRFVKFDRRPDVVVNDVAAFAQTTFDNAFASAITRRRTKKRGGGRAPASLDAPIVGTDDATIGEACIGHEPDPPEEVSTADFVRSLPPDLRAVVDLRSLGLNDIEIAERLGIHRTTVATRRVDVSRQFSAENEPRTDTPSTVRVEGSGVRAGRAPKELDR